MGNKKNKTAISKLPACVKALGFAAGTGACLGAGALIGIANYFYNVSMKPIKRDKSHDSEPQERPYMAGRKWMNEHPDRMDIWQKSDDGVRIHANYIPAAAVAEAETAATAGTAAVATEAATADTAAAVAEAAADTAEHRFAICVHGYSDSAESLGLYARVYHDVYGMNVLLPDLRGHGLSEGDYVGYGYHDRLDIMLWIDWILRLDPEAVIIMHGISMGAATVLQVTGGNVPSQVKACVADASYTSALDEFRHVYRMRDDQAPVPMEAIMQTVRVIALARAGYDLAKASPLRAVKKSTTPTLFIHGDADTFIPCDMMTKLFEAANCAKERLLIHGAEHVQSVNTDPETYWKKVDSFLTSVDPALTERRISEEG